MDPSRTAGARLAVRKRTRASSPPATRHTRTVAGLYLHNPEVMLRQAIALGVQIAGEVVANGHARALISICRQQPLTDRAAAIIAQWLVTELSRRDTAVSQEDHDRVVAEVTALARES